VSTSAGPELESERSRTPEAPERPRGAVVPLVVVAYAGAAALGVGIGALRGAPDVFVCPPLLAASPWGRHLLSFGLGLVVALVVVLGTRHLVRTRVWAEALHRELRPMARALGPAAIPWAALASGVGEELLFRGALVPAASAAFHSVAVGVVASSLLFGVLHQTRGRGRVTWIVFAAIMGLTFAAMFVLTGSLLGPIVAHIAINAFNLRFLLDHDPLRVRRLGGLLARSRR
jgi:hypothetical protein